LNVAITRARQQLLVFTSFDPHMLSASQNRGPRDLREFLLFADANTNQNPTETTSAVSGTADTEEKTAFETAIIAALTQHGWDALRQVGSAPSMIDFAILHPNKSGQYLAGIACDGPNSQTYSARDREKTKFNVLTGLGWKILRIWSVNWWRDPKSAAERLHQQLNDLLKDG